MHKTCCIYRKYFHKFHYMKFPNKVTAARACYQGKYSVHSSVDRCLWQSIQISIGATSGGTKFSTSCKISSESQNNSLP